MTLDTTFTGEFCFPPEIATSKGAIVPPEASNHLALDSYLDALSYEESPEQGEEDIPVKALTPSERRRLVLEHTLKKVSVLEINGKDHVENYLRHQYRLHFQANTLQGTYSGLAPFLRFIKERGKGSVLEVEKGDLEAFVEHEQDRGLALSTVKLRLATVKAFVRFMIDEGVLQEEVFPWKLRIKMPETLPRAMDPEDVQDLLSTESGERDRAMILLLLRTGMRIGELLNTKVVDVNIEEQKILIYEGEKNQRGRVVYFSEDAKEALLAWMNKRNRTMELLFYGYKGEVLSYPAARMMFVKYLEKAGLSHKGYTLHCLRHTYATDLLNARMPLECLEKLLGHSRLEVTRRYAMLSDKTKEEEYFKAMAVIERRERDEHNGCDRELPTVFEKTELLCPHAEELHEHP